MPVNLPAFSEGLIRWNPRHSRRGGGQSYDNGYNDGKQLAQWLEQEVNPELPYLVEIPVLVRDDKEQWELFNNSNYTIKPRIRGLDYWRGWLDGVYIHTSELWPNRAYYYGTNLRNVNLVREKCPDW
ncbi:hypothetical protein [Thermococcus kodakarensis]|uniref:hypothetical protein n=1 Tax=Thermococcus kodakarensis TaxID=311400 RepID=UPI00117D8130|nr:hypothetical protein [Thermococcus kodakarensis]WCN27601.1 hypothetical protein POG15_08550 [Thermococcus kodakarensis]WCN29892.1 hypothetical protein POG21_08535 [Thermococcus kodakarensis]